jgi:lipoyl(octanoyl) transferase
MSRRMCVVRDLGRQAYEPVWRAMQRFTDARDEHTVDELWLVEHDPVFTLGQAGKPEHVLMPGDIPVLHVDRGGQVTYHGPGQLVGYPIMAVHDIPAYVKTMERAVIDALAAEGIATEVRHGLTGVWAGERKIGSIGVHVSRGVTTHGLAVNVDNDLQPFEWIVPCGIDHVRMTSLSAATGQTGLMPCFRKRLAHRVARQFGLRQRLVSPARLEQRELQPA